MSRLLTLTKIASGVSTPLQGLVISNGTCSLTMAKSHSLAIFAMLWVQMQVYARLVLPNCCYIQYEIFTLNFWLMFLTNIRCSIRSTRPSLHWQATDTAGPLRRDWSSDNVNWGPTRRQLWHQTSQHFTWNTLFRKYANNGWEYGKHLLSDIVMAVAPNSKLQIINKTSEESCPGHVICFI